MPHYDSKEGEFVDFGTLEDWEARDKAKDETIKKLTLERDNALAMMRSAYNAGYYQAECGLPEHGDIHKAATEALNNKIKEAFERAAIECKRLEEVFHGDMPYELMYCGARDCAEAIRALSSKVEENILLDMIMGKDSLIDTSIVHAGDN